MENKVTKLKVQLKDENIQLLFQGEVIQIGDRRYYNLPYWFEHIEGNHFYMHDIIPREVLDFKFRHWKFEQELLEYEKQVKEAINDERRETEISTGNGETD